MRMLSKPYVERTRAEAAVEDDLQYRAAPIETASINEEERTIPATISTEQPVAMYDYRTGRMIDEVLVARGGKFPKQIPLLDDHSRFGSGSVYGSGRSLVLSNDRWRATLHFAKDAGPRVEEAWQLVRQGHLTDVSIGYRYEQDGKSFVDIPPGKTEIVDGRSYTAGPTRTLRVVTSWTGKEVSITPIGADDQAKIGRSRIQRGIAPEALLNSQGSTAQTSEASNSASRSNQTEGKMDQSSTPTDSQTRSDATAPAAAPVGSSVATTQTTETRSQSLPPVGQTQPPVTAPVQTAEQIRAERERAMYINQQRGNLPDDIVNRALSEGWDTNRINAEFATARTAQANSGRSEPIGSRAPAGHVVDRTLNLRTLQAAMLYRSRISPESHVLASDQMRTAMANSRESNGSWIGDSVRSLNRDGNFGNDEAARAWDRAYAMRTMSMIDFCAAALEVEGINYNRYDRDEILQRAFSTASLNAIFTTNFNAQLLEGFVGIADSTQGWVREADLPNFLTAERIQGHKFGRLRKVDRNQEIQDAAVKAEYESYKLARYAEKFTVDEMDIIDDRFGMINMAPQDMGEAAGEVRPDLVYGILLSNPTMGQDSTALFATAHGNFVASGAALGSDTLAAAKSAMAVQTSNGRLINVRGTHLIVAESQSHKADVLIGSAERRNTTSSTEYGTKNWAQGKYTVVSEPRLDAGLVYPVDDSAVAGQPATWFLATANGKYGIEVGYLRGTGGVPVVRRFNLDSGMLGVGWMVIMYVAAKAVGYQGLYCAKQ